MANVPVFSNHGDTQMHCREQCSNNLVADTNQCIPGFKENFDSNLTSQILEWADTSKDKSEKAETIASQLNAKLVEVKRRHVEAKEDINSVEQELLEKFKLGLATLRQEADNKWNELAADITENLRRVKEHQELLQDRNSLAKGSLVAAEEEELQSVSNVLKESSTTNFPAIKLDIPSAKFKVTAQTFVTRFLSSEDTNLIPTDTNVACSLSVSREEKQSQVASISSESISQTKAVHIHGHQGPAKVASEENQTQTISRHSQTVPQEQSPMSAEMAAQKQTANLSQTIPQKESSDNTQKTRKTTARKQKKARRERRTRRPAVKVTNLYKDLRVSVFKQKVRDIVTPTKVIWWKRGEAILLFGSASDASEAFDLLQHYGLQFENQVCCFELLEPPRQNDEFEDDMIALLF